MGADEVKTPMVVASKEGISLSALTDRLGSAAGLEFFRRIDSALRVGTTVFGMNVRHARLGFSKVHTGGGAQVVIPGRKGGLRDTSNCMVIMKLDDLEAVVCAGRDEFDWARVFAPRSGLGASTTSPVLRRSSHGRRLLHA